MPIYQVTSFDPDQANQVLVDEVAADSPEKAQKVIENLRLYAGVLNVSTLEEAIEHHRGEIRRLEALVYTDDEGGRIHKKAGAGADGENREYHVQWEIELCAKNPRDAARKAIAIQRDPSSTATVFDVCRDNEHQKIDLLEE